MVLATSATALSRADEHPYIQNAAVYQNGDRVVCDVACRGLLGERVAGTVQSGLPAVVELLFAVVHDGGATVARGARTWELRYDVWDGRYTVAGGDSTSTFTSFASLERSLGLLRRVSVAPLRLLDPQSRYAVRLSVAVHPLRSRDRERIEAWVGETVRGESGGAWHEQVLDITDLVKRLFSRERNSSSRSAWYETPFFHPPALPASEGALAP